MNEQNHWMRRLLLVFLFAFFYGIILWLGLSVFHAFDGSPEKWPMHWFIPPIAFFLSFWGLDWVQEFFEIQIVKLKNVILITVLILVLGLLAFYVNAWFYYCNGFTNIHDPGYRENLLFLGCDSDGSQKALDFIHKDFVSLLTKDAFFYFWLGALFGWFTKLIWLHVTPASSMTGLGVQKSKKRK